MNSATIACGSGLPRESVGLREVPRPHSVVGSKKEVDVDRAGGRRPLTCMTCPGLAYVRRHQHGEIHFSTERRRHGVLLARLSASSFPVHTRRRRSLEPHLSTRDAQHRTIDIYMTLQRGTIANCPITFVTAVRAADACGADTAVDGSSVRFRRSQAATTCRCASYWATPRRSFSL